MLPVRDAEDSLVGSCNRGFSLFGRVVAVKLVVCGLCKSSTLLSTLLQATNLRGWWSGSNVTLARLAVRRRAAVVYTGVHLGYTLPDQSHQEASWKSTRVGHGVREGCVNSLTLFTV